MVSTVDWGSLGGDILGDVLGAEDLGPDFGDRYEVQECLGKGGQGVVYRAWDRVLERAVAVKCLRDPGGLQRPLLEEARLLGRLAHPAIPQLYDRGRAPNGGLYLVMQLIEGQRLDQYLRGHPFQLGQRLRLFRAIAGAVDHAHKRGLLHRDLKPENIMVTNDGEPYLIDWGLAAHGGPRAICGSPYFAAPEQLQGQPADCRADVYALGILLYVLLTEQLPYSRSVSSFDEFRRQRAALIKIPLRERRAELPKVLQRVVDVATAAQPAARYQQVVDFVDDIDASEFGRPLARDVPRMSWRWPVAAALLTLAAAGGWMSHAWLGKSVPAPDGEPSRLVVAAAEGGQVAEFNWPALDREQRSAANDPFADLETNAISEAKSGSSALRSTAIPALVTGFATACGWPDDPADSLMWHIYRLKIEEAQDGVPGELSAVVAPVADWEAVLPGLDDLNDDAPSSLSLPAVESP